MKHLFTLLLILSIATALSAQDNNVTSDQKKQDKSPKPIAPYSKAKMAMGFVFVSGQIGIDPATNELVKDDFRKEVTQVMNNLGAVLKENGMTYTNIVKCTVYLTDMNNYGLMNEVYASFFEQNNYPAREAIQIVKLPKGANVEISAIAAP
jgi:2-iminobutanoate/2-iminopropanoate deaminase